MFCIREVLLVVLLGEQTKDPGGNGFGNETRETALALLITQRSPKDFYQLDVTTGGYRGEAMFWYDETTHGPIVIEISE